MSTEKFVTIIGGGDIALRKVKLLIKAGPKITLISSASTKSAPISVPPSISRLAIANPPDDAPTYQDCHGVCNGSSVLDDCDDCVCPDYDTYLTGAWGDLDIYWMEIK